MSTPDQFVRRDTMPKLLVTEADIDTAVVNSIHEPTELSKIRLTWAPRRRKLRESDFGCCCFVERHGTSMWMSVDPDSLITHPLIRDVMIGALRAAVSTRQLSIMTALRNITQELGNDDNHSIDSPNRILRAVSIRLRSRRHAEQITQTSAANRQAQVIEILSFGFDESRDEIVRGVRRFKHKQPAPKETATLPRDAGRLVAKASIDHFLNMTNSLVAGHQFPIPISVAGEQFLVTGGTVAKSLTPPYLSLDDAGRPATDSIFDTKFKVKTCPSEDVLLEPKQLGAATNYSFCRSAARHRKYLEEANQRPDSIERLRAASDALYSFVVCTYFDTGANVTSLQGWEGPNGQEGAIQLADVVGNDGSTKLLQERGSSTYLCEVEKPRAGNKKISVLFSSTWVKRVLPAYLALRGHLETIGIDVPDSLIFTIEVSLFQEVSVNTNPILSRRIKASKRHVLGLFLSRFGLKSLTVSQIRNFKSAMLTKSAGVFTSAQILGHTPETALQKYNRIEEVEAQLQLAGVINTISSISILRADEVSGVRLSSGGNCEKPIEEDCIDIDSDVLGMHAPSCHTKTGCWMCPHFAIHADPTDYWKLQSYLYVISELRACADDPRGVAATHKPIVDRISDALARMVEVCPELSGTFQEIDQRVANGHVHSAYAELIETYTRLNIL